MRVLITGATGFIGVALCKEMIKNGNEVTAIIRENSNKKSKLPKEVKIVELSLDKLNEFNGNYDLMYHLAWNGSSGNDRNDFDMQYSNIKYTIEAIKLAKRCTCKKFIGAGSQAEYGVVHGEAKEDETICKPFMMYGAAKLAAYHMGKIVAEQEEISFVWPRIYSVYGPGENEGTLISYLVKTLKEGKCIGLFPEGTRNGLEKGEKVKDGAAFFAVRSGAKVIPCGIKGGEKGNRKVTITYGKPLDFSEYKGNKDKEALDKVTEEIMSNILELAK